jgi:iron complex transport system substrate-binding protein
VTDARVARTLPLVVLLVLLAGSAAADVTDRAFVDATGRTIQVPADARRIFGAGRPASVLLLALAPERMVGWSRAPRPDEVAFLPEDVARLPEIGRLTGRGGTANAEVVLAMKPDLVLDVGSTSPTSPRSRAASRSRPTFRTCCWMARWPTPRACCVTSAA